MNPIATVSSVSGVNYAKSAAGDWRELKPGDVVFEGDSIVNGPGGKVELALNDGNTMVVDESGEVLVSTDLLSIEAPVADENAIEGEDVAALLEALETGVDLNEVLEETAAGGGPADEGHGFVRLARIVEALPDLDITASPLAAAEIVDLDSRGDDPVGVLFPSSNLTISGPATVTEGAPIGYTATLDDPAESDMSVTLNNGLVITIVAGESSGSAEITAFDDVYLGGSSITTAIADVDGGGLRNLSVSRTPVVTVINDDNDSTSVQLSATATVLEGGDITYTVTVPSPTIEALNVVLNDGTVITIPSGQSTASAVIQAGNNVYAGANATANTIESALGGGFESLEIDSTPALVLVSDVVDPTTLSLTASELVVEGGMITYAAVLDNPAGSDMTVTLDNGGIINIPAGSTSGEIELQVEDDVYLGGGQFTSAAIVATTGGNFEQLVVNSTATEVVDTTSITNLVLTATDSVVEGGAITYLATLDNPAGSNMTITLSNGLVISIPAGASAGAALFATSDDVYAVENTLSTVIVSAVGGNFESLNVSGESVVTTVLNDSDDTTLRLSANTSVSEGEDIVYTLSLDNPANSDLTVSLDNGETIIISAGSSQASINVPTNNFGSVLVAISDTSGGNFENLIVDTLPVLTQVQQVTQLSLSADQSVGEGESIVYIATLSSSAAAPMEVTLSNGLIISIAAGEASGEASILSADDVYVGGGTASAFIESTEGGNFSVLQIDSTPVTTSIIDDNDQTTLSLFGPASVNEGEPIVYTATLSNPSASDVTVELSNGEVILIATGETSGSISISTSDDAYQSATTESVSISRASGGSFENLLLMAT
jgi:hypothetical protein